MVHAFHEIVAFGQSRMQARSFKMKKIVVPSCNTNWMFDSRMIEWFFVKNKVHYGYGRVHWCTFLYLLGPAVYPVGKSYGYKYYIGYLKLFSFSIVHG